LGKVEEVWLVERKLLISHVTVQYWSMTGNAAGMTVAAM